MPEYSILPKEALHQTDALLHFSFQEVDHIDRLWMRGGYPRSYLAKTEEESFDWRESYIRTFLERDIPNLGIRIPPIALRLRLE